MASFSPHPAKGVYPENLAVLVAEDDLTTSKLIIKILKDCGYIDVVGVASGKEALELLKSGGSERFNVLLSDVHMPDVDGLSLLQETRKITRHLPVVMMSSTQDLDVVYKCLEAGADDYLIKPVTKSTLQNLWQNVVRRHRETEYTSLLKEKEQKLVMMNSEMGLLGDQISRLNAQIEEAVQTPIQAIMKTIGDLQEQPHSENVRTLLTGIVKSLSSSDIYRPAIVKFLDKRELDNESRQWILSELNLTGSNVPTVDCWPDVLESKATDALRSWSFNVFSYSETELFPLMMAMFQDFDLLNILSIQESTMRNFLSQVKLHYPNNPYHNFRHIFDVTRFCYMLLTQLKAAGLLSHLEIFGLLIAAICHDLDHPGTNNAHQIATRSALALKYNDISVLENFHAAQAFDIIYNYEGCNILASLTTKQQTEVRKVVVDCILATDMAKHMEIVSKFESIIPVFTRENHDHRILFLEILLKCADISNPTNPFDVAKYWAELIEEEFFRQGDREKHLGLPVSPFMDRDVAGLPTMQVNFIDFMVLPLFTDLSKVLPELTNTVLRMLAENRATWCSLRKQ
eukprot:CAMPEP_0177656264 /NCGR_PEP_ID=MMETSP0447-20121125/15455_1 /TAXON_ID=0 /ORGANISM="Stygamoeba regulata, Strain BSH-02190019" /LENGTH=571 /DNA_ID=CAMNT_0019160333 /DNA_START=64 /DNA_END=1779 /DNA_ORIENTATION=+